MDDREDDIEAGLRAMHEAAAGVLRLAIVAPEDLTGLTFATVVLHEAGALSRLRLVDRFMWRIERQPSLCLTCDRRLSAADCRLVAIVTPEQDNPSRCLVVGVCDTCAAAHQGHAAVEAAVVAALRRCIWPDLRPIPSPADRVGRA